MKLCLIYNYAQHYRTNIFTLMDKEFECDFVFGDSMSDVKKMDYSLLKGKVTENHTRHFGSLTYQVGMLRQLKESYTHYIILGDTRSLSTWLFCIIARFFFRKKTVCFWTHGWYGKESYCERLMKKIFFRLPNGCIFTYGDYARELMLKEGFSSEKILTIHNSLSYDTHINIRARLKRSDVYMRHFGNDNPNLFFIGRLTPVKKLDQILYAMLESKKKGNIYNLTFIGGGSKIAELQHLVDMLGLKDNVWFYGPCYDEYELSDLIYNADLCVAPGNIGLTAVHSLVFGTPAITHNDFKWQMPEYEVIKEGVTGTFFERDNIFDLSDKIDEWFLKNHKERDRVREACMEEIDREWNPYFQMEVLKRGLQYE